jgi:hypothetical protein
MVAAGKAVGGLCDLNQTKFLRTVRARVFLDDRGDGEVDSEESFGLDACLSEAAECYVRARPRG